MLTKKHFKEVADIIKTTDTREELIDGLCDFFKRVNPKFQRDKFVAECATEEPT